MARGAKKSGENGGSNQPPPPLSSAWTFSGTPESAHSRSTTIATLAALLLHGAALMIRAEPSRELMPDAPVSLETLIPIEEVTPAAPPAPLEPVAPTEKQWAASPTREIMEDSSIASDIESDTDSDSAEPLAEEVAAPTLTDDLGTSAWSMLSGSGDALGRGRLTRGGGSEGGLARSTSLRARDLSRPAIAPNLQPLVTRNYPVAAKLARASGTVTVSALIEPDGNPTDVRVVSVDPRGRGFGETCTRTVHQGPDWKPRLNRDGRPVASKVTYTCHFELPESFDVDVDAPTSGAGANRVWTKPAGG